MSISSQMNTTPGDVSGKMHDLPPVPDDKTAVAMFTAHRVNDISNQMAHAEERMKAMRSAQGAGDTELRKYHNLHFDNHLKAAMDQAELLKDSMLEHYPAEAAEWKALNQVMDLAALYDVNPLGDWSVNLAKAVGAPAKAASFAHLLQTIKYDGAHARRHSTAMLADTDDACWNFDADHAEKHMHGAHEHAKKLSKHIVDNYPAEARWLKELAKKEELSTPSISAQALEFTFDPAKHPRDAHGHFTRVGGYAGRPGEHPHSAGMRTAGHLPPVPGAARPSLAPRAAANVHVAAHVGMENRAYTDKQVGQALDEIKKLKDQIETMSHTRHAEHRAKLVLRLGFIGVGVLVSVVTAGMALPAAAVFAIPIFHEVSKEMADYHVLGKGKGMKYLAHPVKTITPGKQVHLSGGGDVIENVVTVISQALQHDGLDAGLALQTAQAMVAYWQQNGGNTRSITEQATGAAPF